MGGAVQRYSLSTQDDGSIAGECFTNDNLDRGEPTEEATWPVSYKTFEAMRKGTGLSHVGINGCEVVVTLDGKRV